MPLIPGKAPGAISGNIAHLKGKGYPESQAAAIAFKNAGMGKKSKKVAKKVAKKSNDNKVKVKK